MGSVWSETVQLPRFPRLDGAKETDVLIIGGGIAGILCAHFLQRSGVDCMLAEQNRICGGITKNTTAKITAQHGLIYADMLRRFGCARTRAYLDANRQALDMYRSLCADLDCDFETRDNAVYCADRRALDRELAALQRVGCPAEELAHVPLPVEAAGAVVFPAQAQFHPLKFLAAIARDLRIYEHTKVLSLSGSTADTPYGQIRAKKVIVATHFPFLNTHGGYFLKLFQHRSYVLALENAPGPEAMYVDAADDGLSFRTWDGLLLLGGGGHRTGKRGGGWQALESFARRHWPESEIRCRWATQDCIPLDDVPYIGPYSAATPDLFVATGFRKWGMTSAMAGAQLLTDLVQGRDNPFAEIFSPSRSVLRPRLAVNAAESVIHLLTPTAPRCPHMLCALRWNAAEHSWDCPCHGSRFAADGALLDNPATGRLKPPRN